MFRKEINIGIIVIVFFLSGSCASLRKAVEKEPELRGISTDLFLKQAEKLNISKKDFQISKMKISFEGAGEHKRFSGYLKYDTDGKIILSARTIAGIEAARVFIDKDSIKVNDRINRIFYSGSTKQVLRKYDLQWENLMMVLGDVANMDVEEKMINCSDNNVTLSSDNLNGYKVFYDFNCEKRKMTATSWYYSDSTLAIAMKYKGIKSDKAITYPESISIEGGVNDFKLNISIERIEEVENPSMKFSKGRNYQQRTLK